MRIRIPASKTISKIQSTVRYSLAPMIIQPDTGKVGIERTGRRVSLKVSVRKRTRKDVYPHNAERREISIKCNR
jgi:hypothetical protein